MNKETQLYIIDNSRLMSEWDWEKNDLINIYPDKTALHSNKKVWWKCEKGHSWDMSPDKRLKAKGCPYCLNKRVMVGYNDLATVMPSIAKEWHPTKNGELAPQDVVVGSNKKVWWQCERGHEWRTSVSHRSNGRRCPKCFGETRTSFPEQAIFFYLKHVATAYNRYKIDNITELDIYLPEYKIGIEYDGVFWHKDKLNMDEAKNQALNDDGIYVIRVREDGLPTLSTFYGKTIIRDNPSNEKTIINCINDVVDILEEEFNTIIKYFSQHDLYKMKLVKDTTLPFIEDTCLRIFWDSKKNGKIITGYIKINSVIPYWFKCEQGKTFELSPLEITRAIKKQKHNCQCSDNDNYCLICKRKPKCCPFEVAKICQCCNDDNDIGEINKEYKERSSRKLIGLCQYCGGSFKKKYILFGDYVCVKCGKKKDY